MNIVDIRRPVPIYGLNTDDAIVPPDAPYARNMLNMVINNDVVETRKGFTKLGDDSVVMQGIAMDLVRYVDAKGVFHLIALTTTNAYRFVPTTSSTEGTDYWECITPVDAEDVVVPFTGDEHNLWTYTTATDLKIFENNGGTALLLSNSVDGVFMFEGASEEKLSKFSYNVDETTKNLPNCKCMEEFYNHLFLINVESTGFDTRTIKHSGAGDLAAWDGTGSSGNYVLTDTKGKLLKAIRLSNNLIFYSDYSIAVCSFYGGAVPFIVQVPIYETGLLSKNALFSSNNFHIFLSKDQHIYVYTGGTQLQRIADKITRYVFSTLDVSNKDYICTGDLFNMHKAMFVLPVSGDRQEIMVLNYDRQELSWEHYLYSGVYVKGISSVVNELDWYVDRPPFYYGVDDDRNKTCDDVEIGCDVSEGQKDYEVACFISKAKDGSNDIAKVYSLNSLSYTDDGLYYMSRLDTREFSVDDYNTDAKFLSVSFTARSDTAYSMQFNFIQVSYEIHNTSQTGNRAGVKTRNNVIAQGILNVNDSILQASHGGYIKLAFDWNTYTCSIPAYDNVAATGTSISFRILTLAGVHVAFKGNFKVKAAVQTERLS
jgi:hypothetical protein